MKQNHLLTAQGRKESIESLFRNSKTIPDEPSEYDFEKDYPPTADAMFSQDPHSLAFKDGLRLNYGYHQLGVSDPNRILPRQMQYARAHIPMKYALSHKMQGPNLSVEQKLKLLSTLSDLQNQRYKTVDR